MLLTDFGIAHFEDSAQTKKREWLGNRRYAAPEQLATDEVTKACDIYALGRIINEIFTKQNPSGEAFLTIAEVNPILLPLDRIVKKCRIQDPKLRPDIDDILTELYLLEGEIKNKLEDIKDMIYPFEDTEYSESQMDAIIAQACQDILLAQYIFQNLPCEKLEELNSAYHRNILYNVDESIQNLYFQTVVMSYCLRKFNYEADVYVQGSTYEVLDFTDKEEKALYDELESILNQHKVSLVFRDITARIKKMFCSCCNYHCIELLKSIRELNERENHLVNAPILEIVYELRSSLAKEDLDEIVFSDIIEINWESRLSIKNDEPKVYLPSMDREEVKVLNEFHRQYDVIFAKGDLGQYYARFKTIEAFEKFKNYALELSHPYYVFEGDVEKIIRIRRKYHGIVELEALDSFDITYTLAKVLGLRNDY